MTDPIDPADPVSRPEWPVPSGVVARGPVEPPPSKSLSHRYLNLALLSNGPTSIDRLLDADDTAHFVTALRTLGWHVHQSAERLELTPPRTSTAAVRSVIDCGNAGTFFRFVTASLCTVPGHHTIDGTPRLRERPIGALCDALRALGAQIEYLGPTAGAPLLVHGAGIRGGAVTLDASESSQYLSALIMAGMRAQAPVEITVGGLASAPYVEVTMQAVRDFGGSGIEREGDRVLVTPCALAGSVVRVEGDYSAAAYPAAAAALTGGRVLLRGLRKDSAQGDRRFFELLAAMGAGVTWRGAELIVQGKGELRGLGRVSLRDIPDQVPTLAALAVCARGETEIRDVAHLRIKESDRLQAMATELQRLGASVVVHDDGLTLGGTFSDPGQTPSTTVRVSTYDDHRIAMSLALVGLRRPGVVIERPEVVRKSYPAFFKDLLRLVGS